MVFVRAGRGIVLEAFLIATGLVALAEIGDKTQLLSLLLVARYGRPLPIVLGIAAATLVNHAIAGIAGNALAGAVSPEVLRWLVGIAFLAMALWALKPDRMTDRGDDRPRSAWGVFTLTTAAFFVAEIGDKTQLATVALAARFEGALIAVVVGTTLGMLVANVPVVYAGKWLMAKIPLVWIRRAAALAFAALGILVLLSGRA